MLLIQNAQIVNAGATFTADILIDAGKIVEIASNIEQTEAIKNIIDAKGLITIPGGIDPHVHLALPTPAGNSSDDFYTGSIAALSGGTTTIIDFVTPSRNQSLVEAYQLRKRDAETSLIDYKFHMGISGFNEHTLPDIANCIQKEGITSFKTYLAYRNTIGIDYISLEKIMRQLSSTNAVLMIHCEDGDEIQALQNDFILNGNTSPLYHALSRPEKVESDAVAKVLELAQSTKCKTYLVHISSKNSIKQIADYKKISEVFAETCPQYLFLDKDNYNKPLPDSLKYVISPPLRDKESMDALWENISSGIVDVISTDHCPFNTFGQKDKGQNNFTRIPNGAGGIEYRLPLLYTYGVLQNRITLQRFVELTSTHAAKIFGLYPQKGILAVGSDADIVLWDPHIESAIDKNTQYQRCDSNIYEGKQVKGAPAYVITNGKIAFKEGKLQNKDLRGRQLK
jgi:dihydropyrimidinase